MKRQLYILFFALIASFSANASSLYLRFVRQANYTVNIDGYYYQVYGNSFHVPTLRPGRHNLVIETFTSYSHHGRRAMPVLIFNGPLMVKEASDIFASVDGFGFHVDRVITHRYNNNRHRQYHYRFNDHDNNYEEIEEDERYDNDGRNNNDENYNRNNYNYNHYMNNRDFDALKLGINNASFESTKKTVAMSGISNNKLSVEQIRSVLSCFSFESTKLEVARYAFNYTDDKNRYYELSDAFSFDSSKNEIAKMCGSRR